jgi:hypothetical protein
MKGKTRGKAEQTWAGRHGSEHGELGPGGFRGMQAIHATRPFWAA